MTVELTPLERTIRGRLPDGVSDEDGAARRIADAVEQLHMAGLRARIAELQVEADAAYRRSVEHVARQLRAETNGAL